jgi:type II secretory pathway pseudopilin PulG
MIINHLYIRWSDSKRTRTGTTLVELCVVVVVMSALAAIALPRLREAADRAAVRSAIQDGGSLFSLARRAAITRRAVTAVVIDSITASIVVRAGSATIARSGLRAQYGVRITATRDSMSYDPRGLGYGAANLSVVARRGRAAETLFVSRLGRTRH